MRILNVNVTVDPVNGGGTAERTFQLSRELVRQKIDCSLLTMDVGLTAQRRRELDGVQLIALPCWNRRFFLPRGGGRVIDDAVRRADVVHIMGHWTVLNALAARCARRAGVPYVFCPAGALNIFGRSRLLKRVYNAVCGRRIVRRAARWIAISPDETETLIANGADARRIHHIPNGINGNDFQDGDATAFRKKHGLGDAPFVLFVGRLNSIKGPDLLLNAFLQCAERFPQYHLVFVGPDGGLLTELNAISASSRFAERIHFLGFQGGAEKSRAYHAADLLAIPSRREAMSIVVLESGISSTPVLLTDQCGFDDVAKIRGGKVVPATADGIQQGLEELLADPSRLPNSGRRLREFVSANFTWNAIGRKHVELFEQTLSLPSAATRKPAA